MQVRIYHYTPISKKTPLITLDKAASHHIVKVLRLNVGDVINIFDNTQKEYSSVITNIAKGFVHLKINSEITKTTESALIIHLGQCVPKSEKMDFIIQKSTELGVKSITPLFSEHCDISYDENRQIKKLEHWQKIAIASAEQCGRTKIPTIEKFTTLNNWLQNLKTAQFGLILEHRARESLTKLSLDKESKHGEILITVGPEGGFSANEIEKARSTNFSSANLGPRILRTETAAIVALSILQAQLGDLT